MNPIMKIKVDKVTTISGQEILRKETKLIKGAYYQINKDCFIVEGKYNRINNGKIAYDVESKSWVRIANSNKIKVVSGILNGSIIYELRDTAGLCITDGNQYYISEKVYQQVTGTKITYNQILLEEFKGQVVNPREYTLSRRNALHNYIKSYVGEYHLEEKLELWKRLDGYSYGVELETASGSVNSNLLARTSMYPVRDGSLDGGKEYITDIIVDESGINKLRKFCEVAKSHLVPHKEKGSLHVHVGGLNLTQKQFVALYCLCYKIQTDVDRLMPSNRRSHNYLYNKNNEKDYCKAIPNLGVMTDITWKEKFKLIWSWLAENNDAGTWSKPTNPREGQNKWNINSRYYSYNFFNIKFDPKGTMEFRSHYMTFDFREIYAWMIICKSIIEFAKNNTDMCLDYRQKLFLTDVLEEDLCDYVKSKEKSYNYDAVRHRNTSRFNTTIKHIAL